MQALGCKVALDDFGTGYTSFHQLKYLSLDVVKIDGIYIRNLKENTENYLFIKTLLDFSKSYGLETVAEFVESGEVAKILMSLGVDYLQGYFFGKPEPMQYAKPI
jgi:EAL domain-containing protein (putative c-di-GMP-specific phosphodiesterase class I)